jgi:quercetin dioxygenase-like cupin family protein
MSLTHIDAPGIRMGYDRPLYGVECAAMPKPIFNALLIAAICAGMTTTFAADTKVASAGPPPTYTYATNGVLEERNPGELWKILVDRSNLGGKELEIAELTLAAGTTVSGHTHAALEIIYVLSGEFGHEVNGHYYLLKHGMVGIVRPGDQVRHIVPKEADAKVLIIWAPAGEAQRIIDYTKGTPIAPPTESRAAP